MEEYYNNGQNQSLSEYRPMSPWAMICYNLLFAIPVAGFIIAIVFAFDNTYIARRNYARSIFCGILIVIPIILLAAIVLSAGGTTTNRAQLAVFTNNFSQYYDRVTMDALNAKQTLGIRSENVNDAQLYYMVANGLRTASGDCEVMNRKLPVGYVLPDTIKKIYRVSDENEVVAYVIDDNNITGYNAIPNSKDGSAGYEFYGDNNGEEYHFITSNGHVFTLPGFPLDVDDGTIQYYISNEKGCYYITKGKSRLNVGDKNVNGDVIVEETPIQASTMINNLYGLTIDDKPLDSYHDKTSGIFPKDTITIDEAGKKVGRYTIITSGK